MTTFTGFSEEDLMRIKSRVIEAENDLPLQNIKKASKIGVKPKTQVQYKTPQLTNQVSDDSIDSITFEKCRLSLKSPAESMTDIANNNNNKEESVETNYDYEDKDVNFSNEHSDDSQNKEVTDSKRNSIDKAPDIVRGATDYTEDELVIHKVKLEKLQLQQKLMEEQNKKRKEMLAKALADRTKQTAEEVIRLEKIKKELQVLDGQFSVDVAVLRKKIDQACLSYAECEKHYLKVEKEFLQAKINLQKEKEKKELLTEHLCALITHNETRKAQKLETLMLQLVDDTKKDVGSDDEDTVIVDGVDERTGKIVEFNIDS